MNYWLFKSEPDVYSLDDLKQAGVDCWDGVRNYQARNNLTSMQPGDLGLFYHSRSSPPGAVGVCRVAKAAYPDPTAFDPEEKYYDPKSDPDDPRWFCVDVEYVCSFSELVPLKTIKATPELENMVLVKNSRLSVQPVEPDEFERVCGLGGLSSIPS